MLWGCSWWGRVVVCWRCSKGLWVKIARLRPKWVTPSVYAVAPALRSSGQAV